MSDTKPEFEKNDLGEVVRVNFKKSDLKFERDTTDPEANKRFDEFAAECNASFVKVFRGHRETHDYWLNHKLHVMADGRPFTVYYRDGASGRMIAEAIQNASIHFRT